MLSSNELILRLVVAALCAGMVGLERERRTWTAGMRTHMLVGLGAALFMLVSSHGFYEILQVNKVELDPSRVAAQVVSGIGFLGAGTIFFLRRGVVRGLTTASGLWTVAGIGLAIGGGMYVAGITATIISVMILWLLRPLEGLLFPHNRESRIHATVQGQQLSEDLISKLMEIKGAENLRLSFKKTDDGKWKLTIKGRNAKEVGQAVDLLRSIEDVPEFTIEKWKLGS